MQLSNGASSSKKTAYDKNNKLAVPSSFKMGSSNSKGSNPLSSVLKFLNSTPSQLMGKSTSKSSSSTSKSSNVSKSKVAPATKSSPSASASKASTSTSTAKASTSSAKSSSAPAKSSGTSSSASAPSVASAPSTPAVDPMEARKQAIYDALKRNSDSFYSNQEASLGRLRDTSLADILTAYNNSVATENGNINGANRDFEDRQGVINQDAYTQAQMTDLLAQQNGIQNSQQMLGLQAGDAFRRSNQVQGAMTERDRRIADIQTRLSDLMKQKGLDEGRVNNEYGYNLAGARAQADQMYNEGLSKFDMDLYNQDMSFKHDADMSALDLANKLKIMAQQQAYDQSNIRLSSVSAPKSVAPVSAPSKTTSGMAQAYNQYNKAKATSAVSAYNDSFANKQSVVVRKPNSYPLGAPPTIASNPNLSSWQKMKMIGG